MRKYITGLLLVASLGNLASWAYPPSATNRLKKITYSDGSVRQFSYDAGGKLLREEMVGQNHNALASIEHQFDSRGKLLSYSLQYKNPEAPWNHGYVQEYGYDANGRLSTKKHYLLQQGVSANAPAKSLISVDSLIYNATGQVAARQVYSYGMKGSSISQKAISSATFAYVYDAKGNLIEETATTVPLEQRSAITANARKTLYTYDDKLNPYHTLDSPVFDQTSWSVNNCVRVAVYSGINKTDLQTAKPLVTEYNYVYDQNRPVRRTWKNSAKAIEEYEYEN